MQPWKLKRTAQCEKCPWRLETDPRDIPNGYSEERHRALASTIAAAADPARACSAGSLQVMACHETEDAHCVGWLANQLGTGNNLALRLRMRSCENAGKLRLRGEQHPNFDATLPQP